MTGISEDRIVKDPVLKILFTLGLPIMLAEFLHIAYNLADTFWLGHMEGEASIIALAAMEISWPAIMILISLGFGMGMAGVALVSQHVGAKLKDNANKFAGQLLIVMLFSSIVAAIVGYIAAPYVIGLLGVEERVSAQAILYIRLIFIGMPFEFMTLSTESIFRAYGDTVTPLLITGLAVVLNILLDPCLIFGLSIFPQMGVAGAAIATDIAYTIAGVIGMFLLFSKKLHVALKKEDMNPSRDKIRKIIGIGMPAAIGQAGVSFGFFILMYIVAMVPDSTMVLASYGVGNRIINLNFVIVWGLGAACTTMIGQALGANQIARAKEVASKTLLVTFILLSLLAVAIFLTRNQSVSLFTNEDAIIAGGANFLSIALWGIPFFGIFHAANSTFNGSGHNVPVMVAELTRLLVLRIPLCYILGIHLAWGPVGIWTGMSISNFIAAFIGIGFLATGAWKNKVIVENPIKTL